MKLRAKFAFLIAGIFLIPIIITIITSYLYIHYTISHEPAPNFFAIMSWLHKNHPKAMDKKNWEEPLQISTPPPGLHVLLLNKNNKILLSSFPEFFGGTTLRLDEALLSIRRSYKDFRIIIEPFNIKGKGEVSAILAIQKDSVGFEPGFERIKGFNIFFLLLLILASVMGTIIMNGLRRSIMGFEKATKQIAQGNLDFKLKIKGNDEIASLARSFDSMRRKLKEEFKKRSRFLMAISHDLSTPLTSIEGYIEAIMDGYAKDPEMLKKYLGIIHDKSKLLDSRIMELIEFARMETGEWKMKHVDVNLKTFLTLIGKIYKEDAVIFKRNFKYKIDIPDDILVRVDKNLLSRALENLFNNAIRYTKENDSIEMNVCLKDKKILLTIKDTGIGIPDSELKYIFDPFYRGSDFKFNFNKAQGFGLGLATVKSIIQAHAWEIDVTSKQGKGTIFSIHIP